jgi:hypothetical protein
LRLGTRSRPQRLVACCVSLLATRLALGLLAIGGADRGDPETCSRRVIEANAFRELVGRPLERLAYHRLDQLGGSPLTVPWRPLLHPCPDPSLRCVKVRKVVCHDEDVVKPGVVVGQHGAVLIGEEFL